MKKKIFSKLLMGAVLVASISSFVSCKDYDDDISNLQSQIDKAALKADVTALDQKLTAAAAAAKEAADKAEADAQKAQATADNAATKAALEQAIKDINAAAEAAGKQVAADIKKVADDAAAAYAVKATEGVAAQGVADAAAAKAAADAAQKAADEAAAAAKKAQETADANDASKAYAKQVADEAQAAAVAAADAAVKAANYATKSEVEAAQAAATAAADANADAKIAAALAEIVTKYGLEEQDIKGKLSYIGSMQKEFASASALKAQINGLQSEIDAVKTMGGMAEAVAKIQSYDASVSELYSAVTSVELYYQEWDGYTATANGHWTRDIIFTQAIEKTNVFPATPILGEKQYIFKDGKPSVYGDSIVVLVNPVNAVLSKDMIQLVNSNGDNLDEYVEVVNVRPYGYGGETLTRAAANNGLWLVEFNLKENVKVEDLQKVCKTYGEDGKLVYDEDMFPGRNDIRYALKVNNTKNAADRGVLSAYNLCMDADEARYVWDFSIFPAKAEQPFNVANVYNRYRNCEDVTIRTDKVAEKVWPIVKDDVTGVYSYVPSTDENQGVNRPDVAEDPWKDALVAGFYFKGLRYNATANAYEDYKSWWGVDPISTSAAKLVDNRQGFQRITVDVNEDITIEFPSDNRIKGFYVTLDNEFALESKPSEVEAWNKYTYENVGTKTQQAYLFKGNKGTIKVTDEAAKGDVIGFRVYAVHLDGTLYDPDGRAFYISIPGKKSEPVSMIKAGVKPVAVAYAHNAGVSNGVAYVTDFIELDQSVFDELVNSSAPWHFTAWENDENNQDKIGAAGETVGEETAWETTSIPTYQVYFYDDAKTLLTTGTGWFNRDNIDQAKYIKIRVSNYNFCRYMDGQTYKQSIKAQDDRTQITVAEFSVEFTKTMPAMPVKWTDFQYASQVNNGVFNFYPMAPADNYVALCGTNWDAVDPVAIAGTAVGIDLDKVFDPKYIDVANFAYTPDDSYNVNAGTDFAQALTLKNTFKMYIENAAWDAVEQKWVDDEYYFTAPGPNRYDLVKTLGNDDEFSLISHTLAADAKKYATKITYTYEGVSTRIENGKWVVADDYEVTDAPYAYSTCFVDPFAKPTQSTEKKGSNTYSFATKYAVAPDAAGIELQYFKLTGQYLGTAPYVDNLANMLANGIWKIDGDVTIIADNGVIYYNITNLATIATDGAVKISNKFTDESGRPNAKVTQKLTIPLVNILGGKYNFTFSFDMARE